MSKDKLPKQNTSSGNSSKNDNSDRVSWFKKFKAFLGRKKRSIFAVLLAVLFLGSVTYFVMPYVLEGGKDAEIETEDSSPFDDVGILPSNEFDEYKKMLSEGVDYWTDWRWEDNLAFFHIKNDIDKVNRELIVYINPPNYETFSREDRIVNVKCKARNTVVIPDSLPVNQDIPVRESNVDVFEVIKPNDLLVSYCLDEECVNIGRQCILVTRN